MLQAVTCFIIKYRYVKVTHMSNNKDTIVKVTNDYSSMYRIV